MTSMKAVQSTAVSDQARLVQSLLNPALYGPGCRHVTLLETHISFVLLTGTHVYKIRKAVDLEFLDFRTLAARRQDCERELRLNRRTAPALYLEVVTVTGSIDRPAWNGSGPVIEYAVKMRELPQDALLSRMIARAQLTRQHVDTLAARIAAFHAGAETAAADSPFGSADEIRDLALQNFAQMAAVLGPDVDRRQDELLRWTRREHAARHHLMTERRRHGFVRDCHGDLHLGNIALVDGEVTLFDCLEFSERMRWSDVMSDVAFVVMDLEYRGRPDLAARLLNGYLEETGDYAGIGVFRFYVVYRAMVRAKVACFRLAQETSDDARSRALEEYRDHLALADRYVRSASPSIVITHGLSGSGKTIGSQALLELTGALRIRTDVERKRLHGLAPTARTASGIAEGLYSDAESERTYERVSGLARSAVDAGYVTIVDGAFLQRRRRDRFRTLASELRVPFVIVSFEAPAAVLLKRVKTRADRGADASDANAAVLGHQLRTAEPLGDDERQCTVRIDATIAADALREPGPWRALLNRLGVEPLPAACTPQ
jgi:aminoglycoside phosphotransferase family enzyme/gluconate kinase